MTARAKVVLRTSASDAEQRADLRAGLIANWKLTAINMIPFLFLLLFMAPGACDSITDEEKLRQSLFSSYNSKVRPATTTSIIVSFTIFKLNKLDIASQAMSVNVLLNVQWYDTRLTWNTSDYGNITYMVTPFEDVWVPPLVVENAMEDVGALGGEERDRTPVRFKNSGLMSWSPPLAVTASCTMNIARFPFDTQTCYLMIIGWSYPLSEVAIYEGVVILDLYVPNGEFDLVSTGTGHDDLSVADVDGTVKDYRKLKFHLTFRRRWPFYGQNLVIPIVLTSVLMNAVFALPIDSGEKMSFSLTVLLSYVVFLTWVTDNLPPISNGVSVLQVYLAAVLCLGVLATLLTTWVLRLYHTPSHKPVPRFYRTFAHFVAHPFRPCGIQCWRTGKRRGKTESAESDDVTAKFRAGRGDRSKNQVQPLETAVTVPPLKQTEYEENRYGSYGRSQPYDGMDKYEAVAGHLEGVRTLYNELGLYSPVGQYGFVARQDGLTSAGLKQQQQQQQHPHSQGCDGTDAELTWQDLAALCDRFFLWTFGLLLFTTTALMILVLYTGY